MTDGNESDDSDEWGMQELDISSKLLETNKAADDKKDDKNLDDFWDTPVPSNSTTTTTPTASNTSTIPKKNTTSDGGEPMIIVDITQMDSNIHSKFDRNSVNNAEAASVLRKQIESNYEHYARDSSLLAQGVVIPCGSSVWRDALVRLRDERHGHYFAPIFPPKTTKQK
jgi:hypothetical protein